MIEDVWSMVLSRCLSVKVGQLHLRFLRCFDILTFLRLQAVRNNAATSIAAAAVLSMLALFFIQA